MIGSGRCAAHERGVGRRPNSVAMNRALRHARGLTQAQLAERSGVPQGQISRIEQAVGVNPTQKTLLKLALAA